MSNVAQLSNVTVRRASRNIVDHVTWSINEGERWAILGPNGAGKTTLLQLAGARLVPTSGEVNVFGEKVGKTNLADLHPLIGFTSAAIDQRTPASERVLDAVRSAAYGLTASWHEAYDEEDDERAHELLSAMGVDHLWKRMFVTVSSGEKKRIGIARALMPNPELLLLDEPAAGLDLGGREELLSSLTTLAKDPASPAMVLVTHHVEEIPAGFTHVLLMRDGAVTAAGPIEQTLSEENLSACFGIDLTVEKSGERYTARIK